MRQHIAALAAGLMVAVGAIVGGAGCSLDLGDAPFRCACPTCKPRCPDGYECKNSYCVKEGTCPSTVPGCGSGDDCGNGTCETARGETCTSCPKDCGACPKNCGNGSCDADETCQNCPQDCTCGDCGDGTCESGETCSSCPKDCGQCTCGNGTCDPGENPTSCPQDCGSGPCTNDTTKCDGKDKIKVCENQAWKTYSCSKICSDVGCQSSPGCAYSAESGRDVCSCDACAPFGGLCGDQQLCDPGLFCGVFGTASVGFCTKYCTSLGTICPGAPAGSTAECVLELSGKYVCGFLCNPGNCPSGMTCDYTEGLCKP